MHPEQSESEPTSVLAFPELAEGFDSRFQNIRLNNERSTVVHEGDKSRRWRLHEEPVDIPGVGPGLLRVEYAEYRVEEPPHSFNQIRFDYVLETPDASGKQPLVAEMHFNVDEVPNENPFSYDLHLVHRYVLPEYRERKGVGSSLYERAESWAQAVANQKQKAMTIAQSTDQPLTMDWMEGRGFRAYPEEEERRKEVVEHRERFTDVAVKDEKGQDRNMSINKDGKAFRIWFKKTLRP